MNQLFNKPVEELIEQRYSVRNYSSQEIPAEIREKVEKFIQDTANPFGIKMRVSLIKNEGEQTKLGTYGVIRGAKYFLSIACEKGDLSLAALGYVFERIILYCTSLGLGTVWLGGTFTKGKFAKAMNLKADEILPVVSPLGYEGGEKSFLAKVFGKKSKVRKPFNELFFDKDFNHPLSYDDKDNYLKALEMLRLAPSAVNKQPWAVVREGSRFHFYCMAKGEMHLIDIGIALCHFDLTCREKGLKGSIEKVSHPENKSAQYVFTWVER